MMSAAPRYASNDGVLEAIVPMLGAAVLDHWVKVGEATLVVGRDAIVDVLRRLRDEHGYQQLMEIAGVDYPAKPERFEVVYHLLSVTKNHRFRVKLTAGEDDLVPSVTGLWPNAGWLEREVFDMFGVLFSGNADLRRILTDYGFKGHPFRKDFPLTGYVELRWSEEAKRVVYEPVRLAQDLRQFDFLSPWEGTSYTLPGDEKAQVPEAKAAQTPLSADAIVRAGANAAPSVSPPGDAKVTDHLGQTGSGGAKGDEPATKPGGHGQPGATGGREGMSAVPPQRADEVKS